MFGVLKPQRKLLSPAESRRHMSAYCSLCGLLSSQYGLKSRMLVVHDIATLWWLLEAPSSENEQKLTIGNCVRGGTGQLGKRGVSELQKFLAAMSAYTIGIKVKDDIQDGSSWKTRLVNRMYSAQFEKARTDLVTVGFDVEHLEQILSTQFELERKGEKDFQIASAPTSQAYGLVTREIAKRCHSRFTEEKAQQVGESLGRAVYLTDAIRDFSQDQEISFNPLCIEAGPKNHTLPPDLKDKVLTYVGSHLSEAGIFVAQVGEELKRSWHAVERSLLAAAGINDQKSITLYSSCCIPCGDGAIIVDGDECGKAISGCICGSICCCFACNCM
ncbi:DUF5685 family protein [uncultured Gimesia sp.]|uniref:DUF5685 family protein n=1 Tax=uncultured Gimesia sp. TaxID=1678688 RepID=UPI0030D8A505